MLLPKSYDVVMFVILFLSCFITASAKPASFFDYLNFGPKTELAQLKTYSGRRVDKDSIRMVYFNEQTVAIVELGPNKLLLNCELIEIYDPNQVFDVLGDLKAHARPVGVTFSEMMTLMGQCKKLEERRSKKHNEVTKNSVNNLPLSKLSNPLSLLSGIVPGTKWCGTGDIARDYYDLGEDHMVDACCRAHDLCPLKIKAYTQKSNLKNDSLYTKSHCKCDDDLYICLKKSKSSNSAVVLGNVYFNLLQVPCVEETKDGLEFKTPRKIF